jgi:hypothetical protein
VTLVDDTGRLATLDGATGEPLFDEQFGFPSGGSQIVAGGAAGDEATLLLASYEGVHGVSY